MIEIATETGSFRLEGAEAFRAFLEGVGDGADFGIAFLGRVLAPRGLPGVFVVLGADGIPEAFDVDELVELLCPEPDGLCPTCGGSGGGPDAALRCPACGGSGEEPKARDFWDDDGWGAPFED